MNKYSKRLYEEWLKHGKIIIAVDFDSTIRYWNTIENQKDIQRAIDLLILAKQTGAYIVIHTASETDRYQEISDYCNKIGLQIDSINLNPIILPYGKNTFENTSKIFYNIQLCDRSGLIEAMNILEESMYLLRGNKILNNLDDIA